MSRETLQSSGAKFVVTVNNAKSVSMFSRDSQVPSNRKLRLGLLNDVTLETMLMPFHEFDTKPEWGCAIPNYGGEKTYLLKNADYIMGFLSESGNVEFAVQKVSLSGGSVVAEDYPFQVAKYGDYYTLNIKGE